MKDRAIVVRVVGILMAGILALGASVSAFAEGNSTSPAVLNTVPANFNVTVPTQLPVDVDQEGNVTVATDIKLNNNSTGPVKVLNVKIVPTNGWKLVSEVTKKVNAKEFTLAVDTAEKSIQAKGNTLIVYNSTISPQTQGTSEVIANVEFLVDWDYLILSEAEIEDTYPTEVSFTPGDARLVKFHFKNSPSSKVTWTSSNPEVAVVNEKSTRARSALVDGVIEADIVALSNGTAIITGSLEDGTSSSLEIVVDIKQASKLVIKSRPYKTEYIAGEKFKPEGLVIEVVYNNGTKETVTDYEIVNGERIANGQKEVTIRYNNAEVDVPITLNYNIATGKIYKEGNYEYRFNQHKWNGAQNGWYNLSSGGHPDLQGWGVSIIDKTKTEYDPPLEEIMGAPVVSYASLFGSYPNSTLKLNGTWSNKNVKIMSQVFAWSKSSEIDLTNFYTTSELDTLHFAFAGINVDKLVLDNFDTSNVINLDSAFYGATINNLDLGSIDTGNTETVYNMFHTLGTEKIDISTLDFKNVNSMGYIFNGNKAKIIDVSNLELGKVEMINSAFASTTNLETIIGLETWDTSNIKGMSDSFRRCNAKVIDVSNFDWSSVTTVSGMFAYSKAEVIDLSKLDTTNVVTSKILEGCAAKTVYVRSQADADKIKNTGSVPSTVNFIIK